MFLTHHDLARHQPCGSYVENFRTHFPTGTEVTPELCEKFNDIFDYSWAARYLLPADDARAEVERLATRAAVDHEDAEADQRRLHRNALEDATAARRPFIRQRDDDLAALDREMNREIQRVKDAFEEKRKAVRVAYTASGAEKTYRETVNAAENAFRDAMRPINQTYRLAYARAFGQVAQSIPSTIPEGWEPQGDAVRVTSAASADAKGEALAAEAARVDA